MKRLASSRTSSAGKSSIPGFIGATPTSDTTVADCQPTVARGVLNQRDDCFAKRRLVGRASCVDALALRAQLYG